MQSSLKADFILNSKELQFVFFRRSKLQKHLKFEEPNPLRGASSSIGLIFLSWVYIISWSWSSMSETLDGWKIVPVELSIFIYLISQISTKDALQKAIKNETQLVRSSRFNEISRKVSKSSFLMIFTTTIILFCSTGSDKPRMISELSGCCTFLLFNYKLKKKIINLKW